MHKAQFEIVYLDGTNEILSCNFNSETYEWVFEEFTILGKTVQEVIEEVFLIEKNATKIHFRIKLSGLLFEQGFIKE